MALPSESQGLLEKAGFEVLYTGIGKIRATLALTRRLAEGTAPDLILNLGTAGSFKWPPHTLVEVFKVIQRDVDLSLAGLPRGKFPQQRSELSWLSRRMDLPQVVCGTGDSLVEEAQIVGLPCEVLDMEAYALASVAEDFKLTFACFKYVTDTSDKNVLRDWKSTLKSAAEALNEVALAVKKQSVTDSFSE